MNTRNTSYRFSDIASMVVRMETKDRINYTYRSDGVKMRDYMGSTRAVIDEEGNVLQSTAYYPSGVPLTPNELTPQTIKLHTGKDFFDLQGIKVANPQSGIFIKVQGEKASKELIK